MFRFWVKYLYEFLETLVWLTTLHQLWVNWCTGRFRKPFRRSSLNVRGVISLLIALLKTTLREQLQTLQPRGTIKERFTFLDPESANINIGLRYALQQLFGPRLAINSAVSCLVSRWVLSNGLWLQDWLSLLEGNLVLPLDGLQTRLIWATDGSVGGVLASLRVKLKLRV